MHPDALDLVRRDCAQVAVDIQDFNVLRNEHLLITGGTGFVGTWLAELVTYLNDQYGLGIKIHLLSSHANDFRNKVPHLAQRADVTLIQQDVRNIVDLPQEAGWVIHAAGSPDNRLHASDPLQVIKVITQGTAAVLEAATRLPDLKKFLNISSGLVYGPQPWDTQGLSENHFNGLDSASFNAVYAEGKRFSETLCTSYRNQHRLPIVIARPFAFIGPYQHLDRPWAINNFINDSLRGGPIRIQGDGETVRSYMYASDMAWWFLKLLVRGDVGKNYNVGSPQEITLIHLAEKIASNFPNRPKIILATSSERNMRRSRFIPDVSLALNSLKLNLVVDLDSAIQRTIQWNQSQSKSS